MLGCNHGRQDELDMWGLEQDGGWSWQNEDNHRCPTDIGQMWGVKLWSSSTVNRTQVLTPG